MSLRYHKSTSGLKQEAVDWEVFDEELSRVAPCFSDPRFDSLKHVLTVLSSNNAEQEVAEVGARSRQESTTRVPARCRCRRLAGPCLTLPPALPPLPCSCGTSVPALRSWWTRWWRATTAGSTSQSTTTRKSCASSPSPSCRWAGQVAWS
jgi:hypothetical protein